MPPALLLILLAAATHRVLIVIPPVVGWDESWVGTAAINVLRGVLPSFFYGQPYMASIESYLHAVVFAAAGASRWTLKLLPVGFAVVFVYLSFRLAERLFDRPTAYAVALAAALPSTAMAAWSVSARLHYSLTPVFGLLLLLLAVRILGAGDDRARLQWLALGFVGGLTWWNNYIGVIYLGAVGAVLLALRPRAALRLGPRLALPGFVLGSLPMWLYNAQAGVFFISPRGTWGAWTEIPGRIQGFLTHTLPALLGVEAPPEPSAAWAAHALLVGGLFALGLAATAYRAARHDGRLTLIPLVFLNMLLLTGVSVYGDDLPVRYIFPLATVIPLIFGAAFRMVACWSRPLGWALVGLTALLGGWASVDALSGVLGHPERLRAFRAEAVREARLFAALRDLNLTRVYSFADDLNFFSAGSLVFSDPFNDPHPPFADAVDGQASVAMVARGRLREFEGALGALGAEYRVERPAGWWVYHDFRRSPAGYDEIPPDTWTASADEAPDSAAHAFDREVETAWITPPGQRRGVRYVVDLQRVQEVGMIAWIPDDFGETPRGIAVALSSDGVRWETVASVRAYGAPVYWSGTHPFLRLRRARIEIRFPASPARFLRLTQTGSEAQHSWSIRELYVYRPGARATEPDVREIDALARILIDRRAERVYGDHGILARLRLSSGGTLRTLPTNVYVDNHGRSDLYRGWKHPPEYRRPDALRLSRSAVVVLESWTGTGPAFERLVRESGYTFEREVHGDYLVYSRFVRAPAPSHALPKQDWRATASVAAGDAPQAVDGRAATRWTTQEHVFDTRNHWFSVDLGTPTPIGAVELVSQPAILEYPRGIELALSEDGRQWEVPAAATVRTGRLAWAGTHALRRGVDRVILRFPPRRARFVRLTQTASELVFPWSIHELNVYGPEAGSPR